VTRDTLVQALMTESEADLEEFIRQHGLFVGATVLVGQMDDAGRAGFFSVMRQASPEFWPAGSS